MKYNLIGEHGHDALDVILKNRNINNVYEMLSPNVTESHFLNLNNITIAVDTFLKHARNNNKIIVYIDVDCDGYTSSALLCNYMKELGIEFTCFTNEGKEHGITDNFMDHINKVNPDLIIIPDASSSEGDTHKILIDRGIDIIVLDHHEVNGESAAIIVNNQSSPNFSNKDFSGVGIVYKFCQALDEEFGRKGYCNKFLDLVAIGNIADVMDLRNLETRMICKRGLENIQNPLFKSILEKEDISDLTILDVGFKIAPLMNAIIRVGTTEEKRMMFDALSGESYTVRYKPRGKDEIDQTLCDAVIRLGNNAKARQRTLTKKAMAYVDNYIKDNNLIDNKILIIDITDQVNKSVTGLVANKVISEYKRPVILLHSTGDKIYSGSARSFGVDNLKDIFESTGLFNMCAGHQGAMGVEIHLDNIPKVIEYFNDKYKNVEYELSYDVDFIFESKDVSRQIIETIAELKHLWGNGINEPMFVIKNIRINSKDVKKVGINTVTFSKNNIYFAKYFATANFIDKFTCRDEIKFGDSNLIVDVICKFKKDKYGSRVEIIDYVSKIDNELIF